MELTTRKKTSWWDKILKRYSKFERRDFLFVAILLAYPIIQTLLFYVYVNVSSIALAFQDSKTGLFTINNFRSVFQSFANNQDQWGNQVATMLGKSFLIWFTLDVLLKPLSLLLCYMLTKHMPASGFFRVIFSIPGLIGIVVFSTVMKDFYAYDGVITKLLIDWGTEFPIQVIRNGLLGSKETAFITLLSQNVIYSLAGGSMIMAGAFMRIPNEVFESASIDGCGFFRETFQIAIPCAWTTISTTIVFSLCSIFTSDMSFYIYSNGTGIYGMNSIGYYIYTFTADLANSGGKLQYIYYYASAFGLVITAMTLPIVLCGRWFLGKLSDNVEF